MLEFKCNGYIYRFDNDLANTDFILKFKDSPKLQRNYRKIESTFPDNQVFVLYEKELLYDGFIEAHYDFDNYIRVKDSDEHIALIDPIANPSLVGCDNILCYDYKYVIKSKGVVLEMFYDYQSLLQSLLLYIYKTYGKTGLDNARSMGLANGISNSAYFFENYEKTTGEDINSKTETFNRSNVDIINRVYQAMNSEILRNCENRNLAAAMFYISESLFKDGTIKSEEEISSLITDASMQLYEGIDTNLNQKDFEIACFLICELLMKNSKHKNRGKYLM